jgi:B12-binding domain/radical SAM domain protein
MSMQNRIENLGIRLQLFNRLTFPVVLNQIETARLDQYFQVKIIENPTQLHHFIKESEKGLLLYSFMTPQLPQILKEISWINRNRKSSLKTLAGGPHTTGDPESSLKLGFDYAFKGAAEMGFGSFIQNYLEGKLPPAPTIFSTADIDQLDRSLPISRLLATSPPLEITRGCYWNCRFCQTSCQKAKHRSLDSVKIYYQKLKRRGHHRRMNFICPSAFEYGATSARHLSLTAVKELLEYCKSNGTSHLEFGIFPSETRPNAFSEEFVELIGRFCSNRKICIGGQTGSDRLLKLIRRGHTAEQIETACEISVRYHLRPYVDIIFGFPEENSLDRRETLQLIKKLATTYRARIHLHYFIPLSGTELAHSQPKVLDYKTIDTLNKFEHDGLCTGWWKKGMQLSAELMEVQDYLKAQSISFQEMQLSCN